MRICIPTVDGSGLDARAHAHFGSAPFFTLVDTVTNEIAVVPSGGAEHQHGACQPLRQLRSHAFDAVVCRGMGHRALANLAEEGIEVYVTPCDTVSAIVQAVGSGDARLLTPQEACQGHGAGGQSGQHRGQGHCRRGS